MAIRRFEISISENTMVTAGLRYISITALKAWSYPRKSASIIVSHFVVIEIVALASKYMYVTHHVCHILIERQVNAVVNRSMCIYTPTPESLK